MLEKVKKMIYVAYDGKIVDDNAYEDRKKAEKRVKWLNNNTREGQLYHIKVMRFIEGE